VTEQASKPHAAVSGEAPGIDADLDKLQRDTFGYFLYETNPATVFALVALYAIGMGLLTPAVSALVSRRGGAHAGAALGLESGAKSLGQVAGPVLGVVLFGASVAAPFWLASGLLVGLAPIFAWSGRCTHEPPGGRAAKGRLAFRRLDSR
jgi:MFS family permease